MHFRLIVLFCIIIIAIGTNYFWIRGPEQSIVQHYVKLAIDQTSVLECRGPVEFSSNPNQTHLNKLIKVFRITRATGEEFFQGWS